jgi:hypothetical protein
MFDDATLQALQSNYQMRQQTAPQNSRVLGKQSKKKGRGGTATSLISEGAGFGGATGGAMAGAAIGSVVPVLGTAVGGLIGAGVGGFLGGTGGRLVENKVRDGDYRLEDALLEGAISGVAGAGPLRLAKAGLGMTGKVAAKGVSAATDSAANTALRTSIGGKMENTGNKLLASQYGAIGKPVIRETKPAQTVAQLADMGITKPKDAERIGQAITGSDGILNQRVMMAIGDAGVVPTTSVKSVMKTALNESGLVDSQAKSISNIVDAQLKILQQRGARPAEVLKVMKNLEKRAANFPRQRWQLPR